MEGLVSTFDGIQPKVISNISINDALDRIINGNSKTLVERIRKNPKDKDDLKKKLPGVTFGGIFKHRKKDGLEVHSEMAILDFDYVESAKELRDYIFENYQFIRAAWISPSGKGVKALARIPLVYNDKEYKEYYEGLLETFKDQAGSDAQNKDISRLTFESHDPQLKQREFEDTEVFEDKVEAVVLKKVTSTNVGDIDSIVRLIITGFTIKGNFYVNGNRNNFVYQLILELNNFGVSQERAKDFCLNRFQDLEADEPGYINKRIEDVYRDKQVDHGSKKTKIPYVRVGDDYFTKSYSISAEGVKTDFLRGMKRQSIIDDHGAKYLKRIPRYPGFCNIPMHQNYQRVIDGLYNRYEPLPFQPSNDPGEWIWTERLLRHVFGDQYELGLDYIKLIYEKPTQILPILCLVSKENSTGKTTFINWLSMVFAQNATTIGNSDLASQFNESYAGKLIVCIDESYIDKKHTLETLKSLATAKRLSVNGKFRSPFTIDFFAKFVLLSNNEDNFIRADENDIRYWVRKLEKPKFENFKIEQDLQKEVPYFLNFIVNRAFKNEMKSRMWFSESDIETEALTKVRNESKPQVQKQIEEELIHFFESNLEFDDFYATAKDIKMAFFKNNNQVGINYIRKILNDFMNLSPNSTVIRYKNVLNEYGSQLDSTTGRPYFFERSKICNNFVTEENSSQSVDSQNDIPF